MYHNILKPLLFSLDPEKAHHLTMKLFEMGLSIPLLSQSLSSKFIYEKEELAKDVMGLTFKNPVGLAAGFDKDGKYFDLISKLGFGFIEIGTVTPRPQIGNPKPRLFRLPKDQGLINRMGFNNEGVDAMVKRLEKADRSDVIIGGNIGKNKDTPNSEAVNDYLTCMGKLHHLVDYFVVNVSSPNTPGLRELQEKEPLMRILSELKDLNNSYDIKRPLLLKIAPDMESALIDDILEILGLLKIDGLIVNNTSISRNGLQTASEQLEKIGAGGLSGRPIQDMSRDIISYVMEHKSPELSVISVGGIDSPSEAKARIDMGADLVQVYSGLIYKGPTLIRNILQELY